MVGGQNTAEFGANWKGVSDEAHDKALEEADWIEDFTDELKTVKTQDRNKKLSNAQTMRAGLICKQWEALLYLRGAELRMKGLRMMMRKKNLDTLQADTVKTDQGSAREEDKNK